MEKTKKTTILFTPEQHAHLSQVASQNGVSLGELIRRACRERYGMVPTNERIAAVRDLGRLALPVGEPDEMKRELVLREEDLLP